MRVLRIALGACIDLALFGLVVPWAAIKAGRLLDGTLLSGLRFDHPALDACGFALTASGGAWLAASWFLLVRQGRGHATELFCVEVAPVTEQLVARGPFAVHRHPMCVGYLVLLLGIGLVIGSPGTALMVVPALLLLTYVYLRVFEEPCLEKRFGAAYRHYAERVPMLLPLRRDRIPMARRNLLGDPVRFVVNIVGLSLAVLLISFQISIYKGTRSQITTYIDHTAADVWIMQKGVDDFIATSSVPRETVREVERIQGVGKASGIHAVYTLLEINKEKSRVYVVAYDARSGRGGPWKLGDTLPRIHGIHDLEADQVLLDRNLAGRHHLELGDRVSFFGRSFTVAGFTLETMSIGSQYVFLNREVMDRIVPGSRHSFTHVLAWIEKGADMGTVVRRIEENRALNALTRSEFAANTRGFLGVFMLPLLAGGVIMGFLVGSVTIGITLYTSILERFKEYGTLKAMGATGLYLYGLLLRQSLISLLIGAFAGFALSLLANHFINLRVPGMTAELDAGTAAQTVIAGLAMVVLSTGLPTWRLIRLDPMEAFRT
ncbi:MAG: ABC transporter permease [Deltaproteobacteria bacterium]|nr:ABC transporter permease [Deltaproteobacteria bacterium]